MTNTEYLEINSDNCSVELFIDRCLCIDNVNENIVNYIMKNNNKNNKDNKDK